MKQARAVHRTLDILEFLATHGACSLQAIHLGSHLPKSTIRRMLATLIERGYVRRGLADNMYRANIATPSNVPQIELPRIARLVTAARAHIIELTRHVRWPVGLHFQVNGRMRIVETTHALSPFKPAPGLALDSELNIFAAASGLAWLSENTDEQILRIVTNLKEQEHWSLQRFGITPRQLLREIAGIRKDGWAKRRTTQTKLDTREGIAVSLFDGNEPAGGLTLSWTRGAMSTDQFAAKHLSSLLSAAKAIRTDLSKC